MNNDTVTATTPVPSTTEPTAAASPAPVAANPSPTSSTSTSTLWSDLPRRLVTLCIGFPLVCQLLAYPMTRKLFFIGVHLLASWEWSTLLIHSHSKDSYPGVTTTNGRKKSHTNNIMWLLLVEHPLSFCSTSLCLAWIPSDTLFQFSICSIAGIYMMISIVTVSNDISTTTTDTSQQQQQQNQYQQYQKLMFTYLGFIIVTIPLRSWYYVASQDNFATTVALLTTVWNCDNGALIGGRLVATILNSILVSNNTTNNPSEGQQQRRRLLPIPQWILIISPGKSMEGFVGGIIGSCLTTVYLIPWMFTSLLDTSTTSSAHAVFYSIWINTTMLEKVGYGVLWSILAIIGDLMESAMKRSAGIKDSGKLLPGMGGILDRFDSTLLAVVLYHYLLVVTYHHHQQQQDDNHHSDTEMMTCVQE